MWPISEDIVHKARTTSRSHTPAGYVLQRVWRRCCYWAKVLETVGHERTWDHRVEMESKMCTVAVMRVKGWCFTQDPALQRAYCLVTEFCLILLRPHGLQPTRLLWPWDFPGKNTGVGGHFLLQGIFPTQGFELMSPVLAGRSFTTEPQGRPCRELISG